jgi:hypothetical protein
MFGIPERREREDLPVGSRGLATGSAAAAFSAVAAGAAHAAVPASPGVTADAHLYAVAGDILSGNYGDTTPGSLPSLDASSIAGTSSSSLAFTAAANGSAVDLGPFRDAHSHHYTVYRNTSGTGTVPLPPTWAELSCRATRTRPRPTVAALCSGTTRAPPTTTGT